MTDSESKASALVIPELFPAGSSCEGLHLYRRQDIDPESIQAVFDVLC